MARSLEHASHVALPPGALLGLVTSDGFLEARHRLGGAAWARVVRRRRVGDWLEIEVEAAEYARTLRGVDRGRTETARTVYRWSLGRGACTWSWHGRYGERVRVEGAITIVPTSGGHASELHSRFSVAVDMPLLAAVIERRIAAEIEAGLPALDGLLLEQAVPASPP